MALCLVCRKPGEGIKHLLTGYEMYEQYCAEHCPRDLDGVECPDEHPEPDG